MNLLILLLIALLLGGANAVSGPTRPAVAPDAPIAVSDFAHPDWLLDGHELRALLATDSTVKVVALSPADDFTTGHIPGAAQIDWPELEIVETSDQQIATWRGEVEQILTKLGVSPSDTVVVYDSGSLYAARLWWILEQLGHVDKHILDGGLNAWVDAGGDVATGPSTVEPAAERYTGTPNDDAIATLDEVIAALDDPRVVLVDARSEGEYADGHIPGAVNIGFTENAVDGAGRWKSPEELRAMYDAAGVTPDRPVIPYCSTGVRSAVTYFTLRMLGYEDVTLFTGSYKEWSSHPNLPIATGREP